MKKILAVSACITLLLTACQKEEPISFSAEGYWIGSVALYECNILNRPDGTARIYFPVTNNEDTAAAGKLDGTYAVDNGAYKAVFTDTASYSIRFETSSTSPRHMSGIFRIPSQGSAVVSEFIKRS